MFLRPCILVHGGAWATPGNERDPYLKGVHRAALVGFEVLLSSGTARDAVYRAVHHLESDETFNAGKGSVLNALGEVALDAAIMEGNALEAGAVASVSGVLHPIELAREVMNHSPHVLLVGQGAVDFAVERGIETCPPETHIVERERQRFERARKRPPGALRQPSDTVGAVACDAGGHLAAATSTGGSLLKSPGRVGDSPLVGAGLFADNRRGAAASTGWGEGILRVVLAHRAVESMGKKLAPSEAAQQAIGVLESRTSGRGGIILVDPEGELGYAFNTPYMAHAYLTKGMTEPAVGI